MEFLHNCALVLAQMGPFLLLGFLVAGLLHAFVPRSLLSRTMGGQGLGSISRAALLGIPLPLCSCSVIPVASELRKQGAGRGATTAFMVATPETGVDSISTSVALLHPILVIARPVAAICTAILAGLAVETMAPQEDASEEQAKDDDSCCHHKPQEVVSGGSRGLRGGLRYAFVDLFGEVGPYLVPAILITALLTTFIEPSALTEWNISPMVQRLALLLVSIPVYVCATGATPMAAGLIVAGFSPGAALVFLLAGPATNLVTIAAVNKSLGRKSAVIYTLTVALVSLLFGTLLDAFWPSLTNPQSSGEHLHQHDNGLGMIHWLGAGIVVLLLLWHGLRRLRSRKSHSEKST